jgi:serine/threonine-protein kinase
MTAAADRHLLFGLLALQNGLIDQGALVAAFQAWTRDKSKSLADHLEDRGDLTGPKRAALEALAAVYIETHGGDVEKSLAAVPVSRATRAGLARLGEPEIEDTLARVGLGLGGPVVPANGADGAGDDPERTATYSVGAATSDGQRFRILRHHASGGLGVVFVALDVEVRREVALKQILDRHADDPTTRARFLLEAEITGGLEHPGIVPVYGLGNDADGRPYYAMRFIRGDSLKDAINRFHADTTAKADPGRRMLGLRQLLRRFTDVCNAIEYAHSRGVLHRDIKPGNVVVGKHGETLVVDWGLAKALGHTEPGVESGERILIPSTSSGSAETLPGSALGTPAYMSPEQAEGDLEHLGPRSDVYSLGATMYYLLTGVPPVEGEVGDVLRAVQRGEIRPPRQRDAAIDPALEAVCKKAMALQPADRYVSPKALSDDIERWMADEPVSAWRETAVERLRRWIRRRKTAATGIAAAVLVALLGLGVVLVMQARANGELRAANERERAQVELALEAIGTYHDNVSRDILLKQKVFGELRSKLLDGAVTFYGRLQELLERGSDRRSRQALGQACQGLGELLLQMESDELAQDVLEKARWVRGELAEDPEATREDRADYGRTCVSLGKAMMRNGDPVHEVTDSSISIFEALTAELPASRRYQLDLALSLMGSGLGTDRESDLPRARAILERLVTSDPGARQYQAELARCYHRMGSRREAEDRGQGDLTRARDLLEALVKDDPKSTEHRTNLADVCDSLGAAQADANRTDEAIRSYRRALQIRDALAADYPIVPAYRRGQPIACRTLCGLLMRAGKTTEARAMFDRAIAIARESAKESPDEALDDEISSLIALGDAAREVGQVGEGHAAYRRALELLPTHRIANVIWPPPVVIRRRLIDLLRDRPGHRDEVLESALWNRDHVNKENDVTGKAIGWRREVTHAYQDLGRVYRTAGREAEALDCLARARMNQAQIIKNEPNSAGSMRDLVDVLTEYGALMREANRLDEARSTLDEAVARLDERVRKRLNPWEAQLWLAKAQSELAAVLATTGQEDQARTALEGAASILDRLIAGWYVPRAWVSGIADVYIDLAVLAGRGGDSAEAERRCRQAMTILGGLQNPDLRELYSAARARSQLCAIGTPPLGGDPSERFAPALDAIRAVIEGGHRIKSTMIRDPALDPMRPLPAFRLLMMDLDFPENPFAG